MGSDTGRLQTLHDASASYGRPHQRQPFATHQGTRRLSQWMRGTSASISSLQPYRPYVMVSVENPKRQNFINARIDKHEVSLSKN
jgi:hypothetical protein